MSRRFLLSAATVAVVVLVAAFVGQRLLEPTDAAANGAPAGAPATSSTASTTLSTTLSTTTSSTSTAPTTIATTTVPPDALPLGSGDGRRVVFSVAQQRMWWVDETGAVLRTSLVSGRAGTPALGTFQVYSRTEHATGLDGSKMDYFVRFTKGPNGWAIGFHDIPEMDGVPVQTDAELGQPLSHGCIRQGQEDALFTWDFLQVGSTVVVVA